MKINYNDDTSSPFSARAAASLSHSKSPARICYAAAVMPYTLLSARRERERENFLSPCECAKPGIFSMHLLPISRYYLGQHNARAENPTFAPEKKIINIILLPLCYLFIYNYFFC